MNIIWTAIMLASIAVMTVTDPDGAAKSMLTGANNAVTLSLTLLASYSLWLGLFRLIEKTGLSKKLSRSLGGVIKFLFPNSDDKAREYVCMNVAANFLGLGNAATPMGINAVSAMYRGDERATDDMVTFLVLSSTSFQLLPSTVIAMRISHGSANPTSFLPACVVATVLSTVVGVTLSRLRAVVKKPRFSRAKARKTAK